MKKQIICAAISLFFSFEALSMFKLNRWHHNRGISLGTIAEKIALQLLDNTPAKKTYLKMYGKQKKYPIHSLDALRTSKHTKNHKKK